MNQTTHLRNRTTRRKLARLYTADETAWLEETARLIQEKQYDEVDYKNLRSFLVDMAERDKREVLSKLVVLLIHRLKWDYQPHRRSRSWKVTVLTQQDELEDILSSQTLRNYAEEVFAKAYAKAVRRAAAETGMNEDKFPQLCPYSLDALLASEPEQE